MAKKILVVLDPGHYPKFNKGAVSGYYEGDKMYILTEYERDALKKCGIDVIITREKSKDMDLYDRGQVAVKKGKGYDNVVFISNHTNGFNGKAYGVLVIRSKYLPDSNALGKKLADAVVGVMRPVTGITYSRGVTTKTCNIGDYYGVIRGSVSGAKSNAQAKKGPVTHSFIIEHGFHDNVKECTFLNNNTNLKKLAEAEAKVIADYFGLKASTTTATKKEMYRVRKSWTDAESQIGAFSNLNSAKALADKNAGYKVYDSSGKCVYTSKAETATKTYKVKSGDSLWLIAASQLGNGARYTEIKELNGLKSDTLYVGQVLKLPK